MTVAEKPAAPASPIPAPVIDTLPGVYAPQADSDLLRETFFRRGPTPECDVLDLGCGTGVQAIAAALSGHRVVASDNDADAIRATRRNAAINEVEVDVCVGDLFQPVRNWRFDAVIVNPPYVPTPTGSDHPSNLDAGWNGRAVIDRICRGAGEVLYERGKLWMVQSSLADEQRTLRLLRDNGFDASIAAHKQHVLGPVSMARMGHLIDIGCLQPGATHEMLFVIEAVWLG